MPPLVQCQAGPASQLPPIPDLAHMDEWAIEAMGIFQSEVERRMAEHACMADLRKRGVIR